MKYRPLTLREFWVYEQWAGTLLRVGTVTATTAVEALRIAKQKNWCAPIIGDKP